MVNAPLCITNPNKSLTDSLIKIGLQSQWLSSYEEHGLCTEWNQFCGYIVAKNTLSTHLDTIDDLTFLSHYSR